MNPLLMPLVAVQGRRARSQIEVLPEAGGPTTGRTNDGVGEGLRVIVVGESTAAGCGAATHEEAFAGEFARALSGRRDKPVQWTVQGRHGATIRRVRYRMLPDLDTPVDVAVLLIGVNDVLTRTPVAQWGDDLAAVVEALDAAAERTVVAGIPPFDAFPALPRALRTYLSERGRALDAAAQEVCAAGRGVSWLSSADIADADATFFARDGFHPSPAGYRRWANDVALAVAG
ncbi:SGNH/GDSL hydrolase family protein [Microbacterium sp. H1-D42]|uniref:SGNH/GDSL hydrolase family protein n=1 Tax=Microbacterium sp. H1-D42 TaxID=2925844 RepID=UPI001F52C224|nr:SGNH/GDSL hydrolase family protein [Microbacterium sp. H1-D42]UNK70990.1 SGNH/GDSL hydrolase family protein [Microbacterium sp. H1-D42]